MYQSLFLNVISVTDPSGPLTEAQVLPMFFLLVLVLLVILLILPTIVTIVCMRRLEKKLDRYLDRVSTKDRDGSTGK